MFHQISPTRSFGHAWPSMARTVRTAMSTPAHSTTNGPIVSTFYWKPNGGLKKHRFVTKSAVTGPEKLS